MNGLKKFGICLLISLLFIGCKTGIPSKTPQSDLQETEHAFLEGKWDEVITLGEKSLEGEPANAVIRFVLSMAYYMKGEYELQEHQRSLALEDEESMDAIITWCQNLANRFPNNYYAHLILGSAYRAKDEIDKAMESYQRAVEINPNLADAYLGLAATYFLSEKIEESIKYFKKAIEINPGHVAAHYNLSLIYESTGQIDEAIALYEKIIEITPNFKGAYINLGDLYLEKGDRDKAIKIYQKVIELDPDSELGIYAKEVIEGIKGLDKDTEKTAPEKTP